VTALKQRHHIHLRTVVRTIPPIAVEEAIYNVLGMEIFLIRRDHSRKPWTFDGCRAGNHGNP
jgi:hypothetical protein